MTASDVFFIPVPDGVEPAALAATTGRLFAAAGGPDIISQNDFVAIKLHVGEKGNDTFVPPEVFRELGGRVRTCGGQPFLTETSTLYRGERENAIVHALHAHRQGFGIEATGMPFILADGLAGNTESEVEIKGELNKTVKIAREILVADALVAVAHMTGHMVSGFGGVLKTLGMGLASRMGKLRQHSAMHPKIKPETCTFCRKCIEWCPEDAIIEKNGKASIQSKACIGCGECVAVCRFGAVKFDWGAEAGAVERQIAEHALGAISNKRGKCLYFNYAVRMTQDCDCMGHKQKPLIPDLGVFASRDPVAADQATLDAIAQLHGRSLVEMSYPGLDGNVQLAHGEKIGLGTRQYKLLTLK